MDSDDKQDGKARKKNIQSAQTWPYRRHRSFEKELRKAAAEWYSRKGLDTHPKRNYSLKSRDEWPQNIISDDVVNYIEQEIERHLGSSSFPLHNYLHHGLSSQAMTFNLIGPLIVREDFGPLRDILAQAGIPWPKGETTLEFEYDDREVFNENSGQPTSFDIAVLVEDRKIFIESKLVEKEFGGCSVFSRGDCDGRNPLLYGLDTCYLHHIGRTYWNRMIEFGFRETKLGSGHICPFTNYYQFFREILFAMAEGASYVLLHDERSPAFVKGSKEDKKLGLWPFLKETMPPEYDSNVARITVQQVVKSIEESGRHNDWIGEFKLKYGIKSP